MFHRFHRSYAAHDFTRSIDIVGTIIVAHHIAVAYLIDSADSNVFADPILIDKVSGSGF